MGQKVNASAFRRLESKTWKSSSHLLPFNYSLNVNNDLQISKYLKGFLSYLGIKDNIVSISRYSNKVSVTILFYNNNFYIKQLNNIMQNVWGLRLVYKNFKLFPKTNKKQYFRLRKSKGWFTNQLTKFDFYVSHRRDRSKQSFIKLNRPVLNLSAKNAGTSSFHRLFNERKKSILKRIAVFSGVSFVSLTNKYYLVLLKFFYRSVLKSYKFNKKLVNIPLYFSLVKYYYEYSLFCLLKCKCFLIYVKVLYFYVFKKYVLFYVFNNFIKVLDYSFYKKVIFTGSKKLQRLNAYKKKLQEFKLRKLLMVNNQGHSIKKFEGLSLKRLITFFVYKLSKVNKIKVTLLSLENPKKLFKFFNALKKNVKVRGALQKKIFDLYLVLYQSLLIKNPKFFGSFLTLLIKKNIKKIGQIFMILKVSLPSFCTLLRCKGVRIQVKGRINGARRSRIWKIQHGQIPLQTISSNVYFSFNKIMTIHGVYGLKIWYHF